MDQWHLAEVRLRLRNRLEGHLHQGHLAEVRHRRNLPEVHLRHRRHNLLEGHRRRNLPVLHLHLLLHLHRNHLRQSRLDRHPLLRRIRLRRKHRQLHPRATQ